MDHNKASNYGLHQNEMFEFNYKNSSSDYLRGYDVLDKERELLQNRSERDLLLSSGKYPKLQNEINIIKNDIYEDQIRADLDLIINDSPYDWINYDLGLAQINSNKKSINFYLILSFMLGLTLSSIFSLVYSSLQDRKNNIKLKT